MELVSVADPGCLSRIPDPDFYPSWTPYPKTAMKDRGKKNLLTYLFFANFQRIIELFTQKIVTRLSKIWVWDPGSGKTYSGFRSKRHWIPDPGSGPATLELV